MENNKLNLFSANDTQTMSSREIAEITGKEHFNILRDCDELNKQYEKLQLLKIELLFSKRELPNGGYKKERYYNLTRMQTFDLMTGYSADLRIRVNRRWEELENRVAQVSETPEQLISRALLVAQQTLEAQKQQTQILEAEKQLLSAEVQNLEPKAQYVDDILQSTTTYTLTQVAIDLGMRSVHVLTKWLKEKGILRRQSGQWMPMARYAGKGYFSTRTARYFQSDGTPSSSISTVITEKGRHWLHSLIKEE